MAFQTSCINFDSTSMNIKDTGGSCYMNRYSCSGVSLAFGAAAMVATEIKKKSCKPRCYIKDYSRGSMDLN